MPINRAAFFNRLKTHQLYANINQGHVDGMTAILDEWELRGLTDMRWLAYILATVYHETDRKMQPIEEYGRGEGKTYGRKLKYSRVAYNKPDKIYYGRGLTQNTWFEIYERLTKENNNGWDFLNDPDLLLKMKPSVWATFHAMTTGLYTGLKLSHFFNDKTDSSTGARKIINGKDKAELISLYYRRFTECLK